MSFQSRFFKVHRSTTNVMIRNYSFGVKCQCGVHPPPPGKVTWTNATMLSPLRQYLRCVGVQHVVECSMLWIAFRHVWRHYLFGCVGWRRLYDTRHEYSCGNLTQNMNYRSKFLLQNMLGGLSIRWYDTLVLYTAFFINVSFSDIMTKMVHYQSKSLALDILTKILLSESLDKVAISGWYIYPQPLRCTDEWLRGDSQGKITSIWGPFLLLIPPKPCGTVYYLRYEGLPDHPKLEITK